MASHSMTCEKCGKTFNASENIFNEIAKNTRPCYCKSCYNNYIANHTFIECKCEKCGNSFQISKRNLYQRMYRKRPNLCDECMKQHTSQKISEMSAIGLANMSSDKKASMKKNQSISAKKRYDHLSPEEKDKINDRLDGMRRKYHSYLSSLSDDERYILFANWGYATLTEEQKKSRNKKISDKAKARFDHMDQSEKDAIVANLRKYLSEYYANETLDQRAERMQKQSEAQKEYYRNLSEEEVERRRQIFIDTINRYYENETEEQRKDRFQRGGKTRHENYLTESPEKRQARSDRTKLQWKNISEEDKKILLQPMFDGFETWRKSLTPEELEAFQNHGIEVLREYYLSESDEQKASRLKHTSDALSDFWSQFSSDEIESRLQDLRAGWEEWYNSLTSEEKDQRRLTRSINEQNRWANLPDERRFEIMKNRLLANPSKYDNNLNRRFVEAFDHSILKESFALRAEYITTNQTTHMWDYAIFKNDELVMLVDLDGAFFHGDNCDYNGLHSQEEYDEQCSSSVPDKVKIFIINELKFRKSFQEMVKILFTNYDEYIDYLFNQYRSMPFPDKQYTISELIKSFRDLQKMNCDDKYHQNISLNTRLGDRLITHFHPSIYHAHVKGKVSPHDGWYNDELLRKCIENRTIYQSYLNPNKILQGFNISKIAPKVSVFSAGRAKMIINRYLSEYHQIFDPFSGFSGRMLGAISLGKSYIGQDINEVHVKESNELIQFLSKYFQIDALVTLSDTLISSGEYECLLTCPPYGDLECWIGDVSSNLSCDEWVDICLQNFKCRKYVFIVDHTERYSEFIVNTIHNRSHLNQNYEYILLI